MKRLAFTLAEILIALAVIGVIAALVLPRFTGDTSARTNSVRLKSTYEQVGSAINQALIDQGVRSIYDLEFSGTNNQEKLSTFLRTYLDTTKSCGQDFTECFTSRYTNFAGDEVSSPFKFNGADFFESAKLSNGATIAISFIIPGGLNAFMIDVNGSDKPNRFGSDVFAEIINENGTLGDNSGLSSGSFNDERALCMEAFDAMGAYHCLKLLKAKNWDLEHYLD